MIDNKNFYSFFAALLIIAFGSKTAIGISLNCTFKIHTSYWGTKYACVVNDLTTKFNDRLVTKVFGTHLEDRTNDDVVKVLIEHQNCPYLPLNLGVHFKNLDTLYVMKSKVTHLTDDDLTGLTKLKIFDVSYNPINRLRRDFFKGHESIEIISFYDCDLEYIEEGALDPLVNLKEGHFQFNECIDFRGDDVELLPSLKNEIKENCENPHRKDQERKSSESEYDEFHDPTWDDYESFKKPKKMKTTTKAYTLVTQTKSSYMTETDLKNDSFVRRNAYVIIIFLLVIVVIFGILLYKFNAFNRQNWR